MIAMEKGNAVRKPTTTVTSTALGTIRSGSRHSSARWRVASRPESMNCGVERPVRKEMPLGQPPEPLVNCVQMAKESISVWERAGQVMVMARKVPRERRTV
jgi:hypothetical protein